MPVEHEKGSLLATAETPWFQNVVLDKPCHKFQKQRQCH